MPLELCSVRRCCDAEVEELLPVAVPSCGWHHAFTFRDPFAPEIEVGLKRDRPRRPTVSSCLEAKVEVRAILAGTGLDSGPAFIETSSIS
jgi:hypothetical protein